MIGPKLMPSLLYVKDSTNLVNILCWLTCYKERLCEGVLSQQLVFIKLAVSNRLWALSSSVEISYLAIVVFEAKST
jgi:hypothetical protein